MFQFKPEEVENQKTLAVAACTIQQTVLFPKEKIQLLLANAVNV